MAGRVRAQFRTVGHMTALLGYAQIAIGAPSPTSAPTSSVPFWATVASIVLSCLAFAVALATYVSNRIDRRLADVRGLSLHETFARGHITPENRSELVLRNDGTRAVTVSTFGYAYGRERATDRNRPECWSTIQIQVERPLLAPGGELRSPRPSWESAPLPDAHGVLWGGIGPIAVVTDALGQKWQITTTRRLRLRPTTSWRPLGRAVERWTWLGDLDQRIETWQIHKREKRPGAWPVVPLVVEMLWGWRAGTGDRSGQPYNAPLAWRYANGAEWSFPNVPQVATRFEGDPP